MMMVMQTDRTIRTIFGHIIEFKKGESTHVPPICVAYCMEMGAVPVEPEELPNPINLKREVPQGDDRKQRIKEAIETILARNERSDFTASGKPHQRKITEMVGFKTDKSECSTIFDEINQSVDI